MDLLKFWIFCTKIKIGYREKDDGKISKIISINDVFMV